MKLKSIFFLLLISLAGLIDIQASFSKTMRYKQRDSTVWPILDLSDHLSNSKEGKEMFALLSQERIQDIVIINDIDEDHWRGNSNIFIKNNSPFMVTMTLELMSALFENQIIICTKSIFKNFKYLANIWNDLIFLELVEFKKKYNNSLLNISDQELQDLQKISKRLTEISFEVDQYFKLKQKPINSLEVQDLLKSLPVNENCFWYLFISSKVDDILNQKNYYSVYEANDDYLLFLPQKIQEPINNYSSVFSKIYLGLDLSSLHLISNLETDNVIFDYQIDHEFDLGYKLNQALKKIFVNKQEFKKNEYYFSKYLLPRFNIFITGHGSSEDYFLGMNKNNIQPLLLLLNNHFWVKTLILSSCYPGGKRFQEIFGHSLKSISNFSEKLNYTVMIFGSFFTTTYSFWGFAEWFNYNDILSKDYFKKIFNYVSLNKNEYLGALEFVRNETYNKLVNYGSIKFPNTGWIMASDYGKEVLNITETKVLSSLNQGLLSVQDSKKIVLLNYSNIPLTLKLEKEVDYLNLEDSCKLLPVNYLYINYFIKKLDFSLVDSENNSYLEPHFIAKILSKIFTLLDLDLEEAKGILIDELVVKEGKEEKRFYNILINLFLKTISFTTEGLSSLNKEEKYLYQYQVLSQKYSIDLLDDINYQYYLLFYNYFKNNLGTYNDISDKLNFIQKLENLPKSLDVAPEVVQRSYKRKEIEDKIKETILKKKLNPKALPFSPKSNSLKNKTHLNSPKRKVHNPYAKGKPEEVKVDKKENIVPNL